MGDKDLSVSEFKRYGTSLASCCLTAVVLSLIWKVPYSYTAIGFAVWAFAGHLITIDDDVAGGWSNPDGGIPFPWLKLAINAAVLLGLVGLSFFIPAFRTLGA
ncbi:hypothetical protein RCH09_001918 [Actimicrobium sp. GrIS 1.19]|uniref:hypothetical protein n=1 Tax=Actimicrobium sp. GrIS 1.19 TaxID=3071708 RepID=UPI002E0781BC|nr:hypothetical protein [Actimicrobium sp. GrIS 1.19]